MKKLITISLIVSLAFILSGCTLLKPSGTKPDASGKSSDKNSKENFSGSIVDLVKKNLPLKCTYTVDSQGYKWNTTTYISGKKFRMDATYNDNGTDMANHMIIDDTYAYSWSSENESGLKIKMDNDIEAEDFNGEKLKGSFNSLMGNYNYDCSPWVPDQSKFDIPSNVEFVDFREQGCAICASLPDEAAITSCREQLGCN